MLDDAPRTLWVLRTPTGRLTTALIARGENALELRIVLGSGDHPIEVLESSVGEAPLHARALALRVQLESQGWTAE